MFTLAIVMAFCFLSTSCTKYQAATEPDDITPINTPTPTTPNAINTPAIIPTHAPVFLIEGSEFKNTQGPVYSHSWSPDGNRLAMAGFEEVNLWYYSSRKLLARLQGHTSYVWGVAWSPDGKMLASASQDNSVRIWDSQVFTQMALLNTGFAFCVDWSPDGATLAVGNYGGQVQLYDTWTWDLIQEYSDIQTQAVINLDWSPDGSRVLAGGLSGKVVVWDVQTAQPVLTMNGYTTARSDANGVAWSPDGLILASAHQDGILRLWDAQNGDLRLEIPAHNGWARGLAWSPDSRMLASSGEDRRAALWDIANGVMLGDIFHNFLPVWSVGISPSGNVMTSGSGAYAESRPGVVISWRVE